MNRYPLDLKESKIAIGLALESAIATNTEIHDLDSLYSNPKLELIKELHDRLIDSPKHMERVVAIWLQLGIDQGPIRKDPNALIKEMTQMEVLLGASINQAGRAWKDVNDWMNYIANSHQHLLNGFWIDSKILLSRGLEVSKRESIEQLKENEELIKKFSIFQAATASYYNELKELPITLYVPRDVIDSTLRIQEMMLDIMKNHGVETPEEAKLIGNASNAMSKALRQLMSSLLLEAKNELATSRNSLNKLHGIIKNERKHYVMDHIETIDKILLELSR